MARGVNKVILIGNLGNDPDVRFTPNGGAVANLSVATSESWKDKQTGQQQDKVEWHRVVIFGKLAEIAQQHLRKGSKVYLEGKLQTRKWQGQDGQDRYTTEVVVDGFSGQMQMLDGRQEGVQAGGYQQQQPVQQQHVQQPQQQRQAPQQQRPVQQQQGQQQGRQQYHSGQGRGQGAPNAGGFDDFDDDIPFLPLNHRMAWG